MTRPLASGRVVAIGVVIALIAAACGDSRTSRQGAIDALTDDGALSNEDAICVVDAVETSGVVSLDDLDDDDIPSDEVVQEVTTIIRDCVLGDGLGNGDSAGGTTSDSAPRPDTSAAPDIDGEVREGGFVTDFSHLSPTDPPPGTDADLDALWTGCAQGDPDACDELFLAAAVGSDYETFGISCGARQVTSCGDLLSDGSGPQDSGANSELTDFGDLSTDDLPPGTDAALDALWVNCASGSAAACDQLYFDSPIGTDYERFGFSCGARAIVSCETILEP